MQRRLRLLRCFGGQCASPFVVLLGHNHVMASVQAPGAMGPAPSDWSGLTRLLPSADFVLDELQVRMLTATHSHCEQCCRHDSDLRYMLRDLSITGFGLQSIIQAVPMCLGPCRSRERLIHHS